MITDDPILRELSDADPARAAPVADPAEVDRVLRRALADGAIEPSAQRPDARDPDARRPDARGPRTHLRRRPWPAALGALSVLVVAAAVVAALVAGHGQPKVTTPGGRIVAVVYRVHPTARAPRVTGAAIDHEIALIRRRLAGEPVHAKVQRLGAGAIRLELAGSHLTNAALARIEQRATATGALAFYDWEADALLPDHRTVASELPLGNPRALQISQGGTWGAGTAGGMTRRQALALAAGQHAGSGHTGTPARTVVLRASNELVSDAGPDGTRFFVLRDAPVLSNRDVTGARATTINDEGAVALTLTARGASAFQELTAEVAHRGQMISLPKNHRYQHFAVAIDGRLISIPQIDYEQYPDGVVSRPGGGASIFIGSQRLAHQLAAELRTGPLPLALTPVARAG